MSQNVRKNNYRNVISEMSDHKTVWFCLLTVDLFLVFDHELWYLDLESVN